MTAVCVLERNVGSVQGLNTEEDGGSEHLPRKSSAIGRGYSVGEPPLKWEESKYKKAKIFLHIVCINL